MSDLYAPYVKLKTWRDDHIGDHQSSNRALNQFHDIVMRRVITVALNKINEELGPLPCPFSWFVMGSAGRSEQAIVSDQDHGMIYEQSNMEADRYFRALGNEISTGLQAVGYPYCEGDVMTSNPVWCKSESEWIDQLSVWMEAETFEAIRFLLIFSDARVLVGDEKPVTTLKDRVCTYIQERPAFLDRLMENTLHVKKSVGLFRQILTETHGPYVGCIDLKQAGFFPFVNAVRLLAIKECIGHSSTLDRFEKLSRLSRYQNDLNSYKEDYERLLWFRLDYHQDISEEYDQVHYLNVKKLDPNERKKLKKILLNGKRLQHYAECIVKRKLGK